MYIDGWCKWSKTLHVLVHWIYDIMTVIDNNNKLSYILLFESIIFYFVYCILA